MSDDTISNALKMMPYGFYAFTTKSDDDANIMVVNWVSQMSYAPRLIAVGIQNFCHSYGVVTAGQVFGLNIFLQADEEAIKPALGGRAKRPDKMKEAEYTPAPETGVPVLAGAAAYIECKVTQIIDVGGDHDIVVGEAINAEIMKEGAPPDMLSLTQARLELRRLSQALSRGQFARFQHSQQPLNQARQAVLRDDIVPQPLTHPRALIGGQTEQPPEPLAQSVNIIRPLREQQILQSSPSSGANAGLQTTVGAPQAMLSKAALSNKPTGLIFTATVARRYQSRAAAAGKAPVNSQRSAMPS